MCRKNRPAVAAVKCLAVALHCMLFVIFSLHYHDDMVNPTCDLTDFLHNDAVLVRSTVPKPWSPFTLLVQLMT